MSQINIKKTDTPETPNTGRVGLFVAVSGDAKVINDEGVQTLLAGIGEAPIDGSGYNRKDGAWAVAVGSGVASVSGYGVNNVDAANPILEFVASTEATGALMSFDKHYVHGNAAAITGNITFDFTGEKIGATVFMTHNQGTVPTLPAEARLIGGTYTISVNNYIAATLIKAGSPRVVWVTIGKV
jgi:hypothetical protein